MVDAAIILRVRKTAESFLVPMLADGAALTQGVAIFSLYRSAKIRKYTVRVDLWDVIAF